MLKAYHQGYIAEEFRHLTAFCTSHTSFNVGEDADLVACVRCYTTASYRPPPPLISKTWKLRHRFIAFLVVWGMLQNGNSSETFGNPLSPSLQKMAVIPFAGYRGITSQWDGVYGGIRNSLSCNGLVWENKNFDVRFDCAKWKFIKQTSQKCFNWVVNVFPSPVKS